MIGFGKGVSLEGHTKPKHQSFFITDKRWQKNHDTSSQTEQLRNADKGAFRDLFTSEQ
jgi:hypothetical protein